MARSILIIHPGALGDVLLAVPALRWVKAKFPQHRILLLSNEPVGRLLLDCGLVATWVSVQAAFWAEMCSGAVPGSLELKQRVAACDLAVGWIKDEERTLESALRSCGVGEVLIQSPFSPHMKTRHQSDRFLETLGATMSDLPADQPLQLPQPVLEQGRRILVNMGISQNQPLALIHPGSGSRHKCASVTVLTDIIVALTHKGFRSVVIEGPADEAITAQLVQLLPMRPAIIRAQDLSVVAGIMVRAQVYIGHDSGPTHLAALLGVPTIALFGPTDQERWAPRGAHVVVLRGTPCGCGSWEAVSRCEDKPCLAMSVNEVLTAVQRSIGDGLKSTTPRNPSQDALSQQPPCAKVPS